MIHDFHRVARMLVMSGIATLAAHAAVRPVSFQALPSYPIKGSAFAEVVGDFNGDGKPDIAVLNVSGPVKTVSILLATGGGNFKAGPIYSVSDNSNVVADIAVGDFNGDGKLDLVAAFEGDGVAVLLGNGDGTFTVQPLVSTGGVGYSVAVADFNGDGKPDLAVVNAGEPGSLGILIGKGDGTFQPAVTYPLQEAKGIYLCCVVAVGDFNGDGRVDVVALSQNTNQYSVLLNKGDGTFEPPINSTLSDVKPGDHPWQVVTADFNGDGKLDLAIGLSENSGTLILLGNGNGTFQTPSVISLGGFLAVADLNGDHVPDLVIASGNVSLLLGKGDGTFQAPASYFAGQFAYIVRVADLNGDGVPDLVIGSGFGQIAVLLGSGGGGFEERAGNFATGTKPMAVATGDFNGDGKQDMAVANYGSGDISVLLGNGDGTFRPQVTYQAGKTPSSIAVADLNGDGIPDLVVAGQTVSVLFGNGDGTFKAPVDLGVRAGFVAVGDVNGDGKLDLVTGGAAQVAVSLGNGDGTFQPAQRYKAGGHADTRTGNVALADFNGDGRLDIAVTVFRRQSVGHISVLLGNGDGTFQAPKIQRTSVASGTAIAVGDFNGDGRLDIATNLGGGVKLLFGEGNGRFQPGKLYPGSGINTMIQCSLMADFNGDGKLDIVAAGDGSAQFLLGNGNHPVMQYANFAVGDSSQYMAIAAADFNGDGKLDLAVPYYSGNSVQVLLNTTK